MHVNKTIVFYASRLKIVASAKKRTNRDRKMRSLTYDWDMVNSTKSKLTFRCTLLRGSWNEWENLTTQIRCTCNETSRTAFLALACRQSTGEEQATLPLQHLWILQLQKEKPAKVTKRNGLALSRSKQKLSAGNLVAQGMIVPVCLLPCNHLQTLSGAHDDGHFRWL